MLVVSIMTAALTSCGGSGKSTTTTTTTTTPSVASLSGSYVFSASGNEDDGAYFAAGSFTADGKGNITSGVADYNLPAGVDAAVQLTGNYTISSSGSGTVNLTDGQGTQDTFQIQPGPAGSYYISGFDSSGAGTLQPFTGAASTSNVNYNFSLTGQGYGTITASGTFALNAAGNISSGTESYTDSNLDQTQNNLTGFVGAANSNRGYAQIGGNAFSYYIAGPNQLVLVGLDDQVLLYGTAQLK